MCTSEVMYGAYYPYLQYATSRAGPTTRPFGMTYQYDRFNQDLYSSTGAVPLTASTSTSANSHSPCSPLLPSTSTLNSATSSSTMQSSTASNASSSLGQRHVTKEEEINTVRSDAEATITGAHNDNSCSSNPEESPNEGESNGRTQYLSATCIVVTNYSGDVATVVDDHFTRALSFNDKNSKESSNPMSTRNFPASFWNSNYVPPTPAPHHQMSDLYSSESGLYSTEPWVHNAAHYGPYAAHAAHAHAYHHNMAQYGSLLRLPQQYGHSSRLHHDQQTAHALAESAAAAYSNYPMSGLEAQESSKDLYWF